MNNSNNKIDYLFFKIWRNKNIISTIFNFLKSGDGIGHYSKEDDEINQKNIFKFNEIINIGWMIYNNHIGLLFNKVKRGDYLTFQANYQQRITSSKRLSPNSETYVTTSNYEPYPYFSSTNFKQSWISESREFYINLFKNYSNQFIYNKESKFTTALIMVLNDLVVGFQVLIEENYLTGSLNILKLFKKSIYYGSLKISQYIFIEIYKSNIDNIYNINNGNNQNVNSSISNSSNNKSLKRGSSFIDSIGKRNTIMINSITDGKIATINKNKVWDNLLFLKLKDPIQLSNMVEFVLKDLKILPPFKEFKQHQIFKTTNEIYKEKLSVLVKMCKCVLMLSEYFKKSTIMKTQIPYLGDSVQLLAQLELDNMESKFIKQGILSDVISDICGSESNVQYLYKMIIPFLVNPEFSISFYYIKYQNNYSYSLDFNPISFGDYFINNTSIFTNLEENDLKYTIFEYCKYDRDKQIQFCQDVIKDNQKSSTTGTTTAVHYPLITASKLFKYLLKIDDLELIKMVYEGLYKQQQQQQLQQQQLQQIFPNDIFILIKSIETFNYLYEKINNDQIISGSEFENDLLYKSKIKIFKNQIIHNHFQKQHQSDYHQLVEKLIEKNKEYSERQSLEFNAAKYAIENSIIDQTDVNSFNTILFSLNYKNLKTLEYVWLLEKQELQTSVPVQLKYPLLVNNNGFSNLVKVIEWIYNNRKDDLYNEKYIDNLDIDSFYLFHYFNNSLNFYIKLSTSDYFFKYSNQFLKQIAIRGDVETLGSLMSTYFYNEQQSIKSKSYIYSLLLQCSEYGTISIFKFLYDNYSFIFNTLKESTLSYYLGGGGGDEDSTTSKYIPSFIKNKYNSLSNNTDNNNNNNNNPLNKLTKSKLDEILKVVISNGHIELLLFLKESILTTPVQSYNMSIPNSFFIETFNNISLLSHFNIKIKREVDFR